MTTEDAPLIHLASRSPRRRALLEQLGINYALVDQDLEETLAPGESPEVFVIRLALEKARAGLVRLDDEGAVVLGADTVVALDDEVLGKPESRAAGLDMLSRLSGRAHRVLTGVAMVDGEHEATRLSLSTVTFRHLGDSEMQRYWESAEPLDKAGGYAIQGRGGVFVEHLDGSYSGVMGLPLFEVHDLLDEFGLDYQSGWPVA